jgi:glutathione S-transferase
MATDAGPPLKIIGRASSINVRKVLWTCDEIGLDWIREEAETAFGLEAVPALLTLNPNGLMPVVIDEAGPLWESNTICRYLAAKLERTDLLPKEPRQRAEVEQWMDWQAADLNAAWNYAFQAKVRCNPMFRDETLIARSIAAWNEKMEILDQRLALTGAYVTGDRFTIADIVVGLSVNRWLLTPLPRPERPFIAAYRKRLEERRACEEHCFNGIV